VVDAWIVMDEPMNHWIKMVIGLKLDVVVTVTG
jgi:hypothetical protein